MQWLIFTFDITATFLHAIINPGDDPIFVWPPEESSPLNKLLWRLKRALYGLRTAPRAWQKCFAEELQKLGFRRLKSDGNIYVHMIFTIIIFVYVDDFMVFGELLHIQD